MDTIHMRFIHHILRSFLSIIIATLITLGAAITVRAADEVQPQIDVRAICKTVMDEASCAKIENILRSGFVPVWAINDAGDAIMVDVVFDGSVKFPEAAVLLRQAGAVVEQEKFFYGRRIRAKVSIPEEYTVLLRLMRGDTVSASDLTALVVAITHLSPLNPKAGVKPYLEKIVQKLIGSVKAVARLSSVAHIDPKPTPPQNENATAAQLSHIDLIRDPASFDFGDGFPWPNGLTGGLLLSPVSIGVWDSGKVDIDHRDFGERVTVVATDYAVSEHSTHVSGTIAGAGDANSVGGMAPEAIIYSYSYGDRDLYVGGNPYVPPDVPQEMSDAAVGKPSSILDDHHVTLSNNSWGRVVGLKGGDCGYPNWSDFGAYDGRTRAYDELARSRYQLLIVKSSGNDGNDKLTVDVDPDEDDYDEKVRKAKKEKIRSCFSVPDTDPFGLIAAAAYLVFESTYCGPARISNSQCGDAWDGDRDVYDGVLWSSRYYDTIPPWGVAKNVLTVGAVQDDLAITSFSSSGPTNDGRIKPDIVANGQGLRSTLPGGGYGWMSGTSMSSPVVTGALALLQEAYRGYFNVSRPQSYIMKALLIQTAQDRGQTGPDFFYGHGLLDAGAAVQLLKDQRATLDAGALAGLGDSYTQILRASISNVGDRVEKVINVEAWPTGGLKATLVWLDPAGSTSDWTKVLVNDLDVVLTGPDGEKYYPYTMPYARKAHEKKYYNDNAVRDAPNHTDNVEVIEVRNRPASWQGKWTIAVTAKKKEAGAQYFALIANAPMTDAGTSFSLSPMIYTIFEVGERVKNDLENRRVRTTGDQVHVWVEVPDANPDDPPIVTGRLDGSASSTANENMVMGRYFEVPIASITEGEHEFVIEAVSASGIRHGATDPYAVVRDTAPPQIEVLSHAEGSHRVTETRQTIDFGVTDAGPIENVRCIMIGQTITATVIEEGRFSCTIALDATRIDEEQPVTISARDDLSNSATKSVSFILVDEEAPEISVTAPTDSGSYISNIGEEPMLTISGKAQDNVVVAHIEYLVLKRSCPERCEGEAWIDAGVSPGGSWSFPVDLGDRGPYCVIVRAVDSSGNSDEGSCAMLSIRRYTPDAPVVTIDAPASPDEGRVRLTGRAVDPDGNERGIASMQWRVRAPNGTISSLADVDDRRDDGEHAQLFSLPLQLSEGISTVTIIAVDADGQEGAADVVIDVPIVDRTPPTVTITAPEEGSHSSVTRVRVEGTATDDVAIDRVEVRVNEGDPILATIDGDRFWIEGVSLMTGSNTITVTAFDTADEPHSTSAQVTVTYGKSIVVGDDDDDDTGDDDDDDVIDDQPRDENPEPIEEPSPEDETGEQPDWFTSGQDGDDDSEPERTMAPRSRAKSAFGCSLIIPEAD